jgi:hypothetical protein
MSKELNPTEGTQVKVPIGPDIIRGVTGTTPVAKPAALIIESAPKPSDDENK